MKSSIVSVLLTAAVTAIPIAAAAQQCFAPPSPTRVTGALRNTVVITPESNVFKDADFSLGATLGNIIKTSVPAGSATPVVDSQAERIALLATLVRSFRATEHLNSESNLRFKFEPRSGEAALDPIKLLDPQSVDVMRPVALFNRWDLAPNDFRYCGEHRIVYAKGNPVSATNRFFLIFEAGLDNPDPQNRKEGCRPVIEFWESLKAKSGPALATALHDFYYKGISSSGGGQPFQPVVHHQHYGVPYGQVRGNLFVIPANAPFVWQLREWRTTVSVDGAPVFAVDTVKKNPHPGLFAATTAGEESGFDGLRKTFSEEFVRTYVNEMTALEQKKDATGNKLINAMGANLAGRFDHFVSNAAVTDDPAVRAKNTTIPNRITARLTELNLSNNCLPTADQILNRSGALSCGGCHQFSAGKEIAPQVQWPNSLGFVHVDENGKLSEALENHFLAARRAQLEADMTPAPATAPTTGPVAVLNAREALFRVQNAETRIQAIDALRDLENKVQSLRALNGATTGASTTFRRTH